MGTIKSSSNTQINGWLTELNEDKNKLNFTDFKVIHDPTLIKPTAGREFNDGEYNKATSKIATEEIHGILVPIIDINGYALGEDDIIEMLLSFKDFTPKLILTINDSNRQFQFRGGMGLSNRVNVIITPKSKGIYRKISVPFYIESQETNGNEITFTCNYYHNGLWKNACEQIGDSALSTYDFCEKISKMLQLGFAVTEHCKEIDDKRWRQIYSERLSTYITDQIKIGGIDEKSIFDAWIDHQGYLSLINLSWVLEEKVEDKDLMIKTVHYQPIPMETTGISSTNEEPIEIKRFITNWTNIPMVDHLITEQQNNLNTEVITELGTCRNCWVLKDVGGTNVLEMQNIQMIENSVEANESFGMYESVSSEFIGCEMSEDTPYLLQKEIRKSYMVKHRSRQITVTLNTPNYGLSRGMLISVLYMETDMNKIQHVTSSYDNTTKSKIKKDESGRTNSDQLEEYKERAATNDEQHVEGADASTSSDANSAALNMAISGIYYIDGIEYYYSEENNKIIQYMYLIKKGNQSNISNPFTGV